MTSESKRQWMQTYEGKIRVGPEYQAMIPPFYKANYQQSQNKNGQNTSNLSSNNSSNTSASTSTSHPATTENRLHNVATALTIDVNTSQVLEDEEYIQSYDNLVEEPYDLDISNHLQFQEGDDSKSGHYDLKGQDSSKAHDDLKETK